MEYWLPVINFEGLYSVSDHGRVRREVTRTNAKKGEIRKQSSDTYGYQILTLSYPGKYIIDEFGQPIKDIDHPSYQRVFTVHKLVWEAFNGPIPKGLTINHKDGDKTNNHLDNLELLTIGDNIRHAIRKLGQDRKGHKNPSAKLTVEQVARIRELRANGTKVKDICLEFGISNVMVGKITSGQAWENAPGPITPPRLGRPPKR